MSKFVDKKLSIQARIDRGLHQLLTATAKKRSMTIKALLEEYVVFGLDKDKHYDK